MIPKQPFNVWVMDVDDFIKKNRCLEVSSHSIYSASTTDFHPQGLFSEEIFGEIGTPDRLVRFGYINLNTKIFQPPVYQNIIQLKQIYSGIMAGSVYAKFDEEDMDLVRCSKDDPDGDTGYSFFMKHYPRIKFTETESQKRKDRIAFLEKYKDNLYCDKLLVEPAAIRDIKTTDGMMSQEDINKIYLACLSFAGRLPPGTTNPIYDSIRMNILKKAFEVYEYIENILTGKKGFLRGSYARRKIALGTRNVISAAKLNLRTPNDPRGLAYDETWCPLFQTMKAFQPLVCYHLRTLAFDPIFPPGATQIPLIDKDTLSLNYVEVDTVEAERFRSIDGIDIIINRFKDIHIRHNPATAKGVDGKTYYLYLVHDYKDRIIMFRNLADFIETYKGEQHKEAIRPMTWAELMYIATARATAGKHVFITRYPVGQGSNSTGVTKCVCVSTQVSRSVDIVSPIDPNSYVTMPFYPIADNSFVDSLMPHPSALGPLAGDFDGDTASMNSICDDGANAQATEYLNNIRSIITADQKFLYGLNTDNGKLMIYNLTREGWLPGAKLRI